MAVVSCLILGIQSRLDMVLFFIQVNPVLMYTHTGKCGGVFSFDFKHPYSSVFTISLTVAFRSHNGSKQSN